MNHRRTLLALILFFVLLAASGSLGALAQTEPPRLPDAAAPVSDRDIPPGDEKSGAAQAPTGDAPVPDDVVYADDLIVQYSLCVGYDCVNNENFGFDTIRLKENNLRIHFEDTSNSASFPTTDWRLIANDSANGGASYFLIEDSTAGTQPFRVEAGAPTHLLYLDSSGRVGIGTNDPQSALHVMGVVTELSDRNAKENFSPVDGESVLARLLDLPLTIWNYKQDPDTVRHMGPTAQDFYAAFGLGASDTSLAALDVNGVTLAAVQELAAQLAEKDAELAAVQAQNADMQEQLNDLTARLAALEALLAAQPPAGGQD